MQATAEIHQARAVTLGRRLELFTIVVTAAEAALGLWSAWQAHALSLAAFGLDSLIELASAVALLWRLQHQNNPHRRELAEQRSLRIAAFCLLALAAYVLVGALLELRSGAPATANLLGIVITAAALLLMPLLARGKRRVAALLDSDAMFADSRQADFCALQALIVLLGLVAARWWNIRWADSVAALLLVPLIAREGVRALQGKSCGCTGDTNEHAVSRIVGSK
jgi:divalent metal cation (Fe/Co/Zn/Cd) transporter